MSEIVEKFRPDIQWLRGYAVLVVVLFHAHIEWVKGGYLGVDIFFVISGFLVTGMLLRQIDSDDFSFREFYFRRAKRLLPAAYCTFLLSIIGAVFLLTSKELVDFSQQLLGAILFSANVVLRWQGSYFGVESDLKPLLHIWSLSIEEQYYALIPAVLFFLPRKYWFRFILVSLLGSLLLCTFVYEIKPDAAFYLFPFRAWELAIGSCGAFMNNKNIRVAHGVRILFWPSGLIVTYLTISPFGGQHPGIDAVLVCIATLVILLAKNQRPFTTKAAAPICWLGDISYSLYLIHWPLFSLAFNLWFDQEHFPLMLRIRIVLVAILFGYLQYTFVENPIRSAPVRYSLRHALMFLVASLSILAMALMLPYRATKVDSDYIFARRGNVGLHTSCAFDDKFFTSQDCVNVGKPDLLVWGDSNAMHLIPGLNATRERHVLAQATKYTCGPLLGVAPVGVFTGSQQNESWAENCLQFNRSVLEFVKGNSSITTVVLSSYFSQYLDSHDYALTSGFGSFVSRLPDEHKAAALAGLGRTVSELRSLGKKVVIVAPPPAMDFDVGRCIERIARGLPNFGKYHDCEPESKDVTKRRAAVYDLLAKVEINSNVSVIRLNDTLDRGGKIMAADGGNSIFIANAHLSNTGSIYLAKKMDLIGQIQLLAR